MAVQNAKSSFVSRGCSRRVNESGMKPNPYFSPEKWGLELLAEVETGGSYEFCTSLLFRHSATAVVYVVQDAGCSCPTPFEWVESLSDMVEPQTEDEVARLLGSHHYDLTLADSVEFVRAWKLAREAKPDASKSFSEGGSDGSL